MAIVSVLPSLAIALLVVLQDHCGTSLELDGSSQSTKEILKDLEDLWTIKDAEKAILELWVTLNLTSLNLSSECSISVENISLSELITLIDSTGKQGAGLLSGNVLMDGAYDECFSQTSTAFCLANGVKVLNLNTLQLPSLKIGLCVPRYCGSADVAEVINASLRLAVDQKLITCTNSKTPSYSIGAIIMGAVLLCFVSSVMFATIVDEILHQISHRKEPKPDPVIIEDNGKTKPTANSNSEAQTRPVLVDIIKAFSLLQNVPKLLSTKQNASTITCVNGLRVISMFWVILGYTYIFLTFYRNINNLIILKGLLSRFSFQVIGGGFYSVDSFFFLSGLLSAYVTLRELKQKEGRFPWLSYYVHRYLRLTPTYVFIIFFAWFLTKHLAYGPKLNSFDIFYRHCSKYWWTNLLYISNLYPWKWEEECINWGWYLSNDMQFYVISPIMIFVVYRNFKVGTFIATIVMISGFLVTGILTGMHNFPANTISQFVYNYYTNETADEQNNFTNFLDVIYIKPWAHIATYIVGLALGYVLNNQEELRPLQLINTTLKKAFFYCILWVLAVVVAFWLVYGLYFAWHDKSSNILGNIVFITFSRFLWACCLAVVVFACHNGYGWYINSFLSMKLWIPLAKLTFSAYLVHPIVIIVIYGQLQTSIHYTDISLACYCIVFVVVSYGAAAVLCLLVEFPLGQMENVTYRLLGSVCCSHQKKETMKISRNKKKYSNSESIPVVLAETIN